MVARGSWLDLERLVADEVGDRRRPTSTASIPARSSASTSSRLSTSTRAIASLPAGTSGSSSSTASSGSASSSSLRGGEQEDLGVALLEGELELLLVPDVDDRLQVRDAVYSSSGRSVRSRRRPSARPPPIQSSGSEVASRMPSISRETASAFAPCCLGVSRAARVVDAGDDRDPVTLGDALAEAA